MSKGMDDMVKKDVQKFKDAESLGRPDLPTAMEYTFWTGAILSVLAMMVMMPFVGPDKAIPGITWLAVSLGGITFFGGMAMAVRLIPE